MEVICLNFQIPSIILKLEAIYYIYHRSVGEAMVVYEPVLVFCMVEHEQLQHINRLLFHLHLKDYIYTCVHIHVHTHTNS